MSMSMTPETPTPETDDHSDRMDNEDFDVELALTYDLARRLERERDAARQALAEVASHLSGFLGFHADGLSLDQVRMLSVTLAKLKLFITDAPPVQP